MISYRLALPSLLLLVASSCASTTRVVDDNGSAGIGNAIVFDDESLAASRGGFLTILQGRIRGMTVSRGDICPHVVLRGGAGRSAASEPLVYLDGQRIGDTCILDTLDVETIDRAEVYPNGITNRPGYHSNSGGLILVFMKDGTERAPRPPIR